MRAAICTQYGPPEVVQITDVPVPEPGPHEVLIRIQASTVSTGDWRIRALAVPRGLRLATRLAFGFSRPRVRILGSELCGVVVATGRGVTRFEVGAQVIAFPGTSLGCHAEYRTMPETGRIVRRPENLNDAEGSALCFGGTTALHFLRDRGGIRAGHRVLIIGASGSVGSAAIQLARHFGAEVTAVSSAANHELVRSLGAHHTIDYTIDDYTRCGQRYDLVMDTVNATTFDRARRILEPDGKFLMVAADLPAMLRALGTVPSRQKAICGVTPERLEDLQFLADLATAGGYRPVIDSEYPLVDIASAHERVQSGRKRGNVVLRIFQS